MLILRYPKELAFCIYIFQIGNAISLDHEKKQWIDLGIHTSLCMTRTETCGAAGGAVAFWFRLSDKSVGDDGMITTTNKETSTGFHIFFRKSSASVL